MSGRRVAKVLQIWGQLDLRVTTAMYLLLCDPGQAT